jgi:cyanophycinase
VAVIPVASRLARTGDEYAEAFRRHGAGDAVVLDFRSRVDGEHADAQEELGRADGVFFTGGDQVRLPRCSGTRRAPAC